MNADSDAIYYTKKWEVIKHEYFYWVKPMTEQTDGYTIIRKDLTWFEARDLKKVLNKLKGK